MSIKSYFTPDQSDEYLEQFISTLRETMKDNYIIQLDYRRERDDELYISYDRPLYMHYNPDFEIIIRVRPKPLKPLYDPAYPRAEEWVL